MSGRLMFLIGFKELFGVMLLWLIGFTSHRSYQ
jgi:hypothetical protein